MEDMVLEVFQTNSKDKLYEILHHKHQLLQIQHALGSQDFQQFISAFQMITVQNNDCIDLFTGNLYYFLTGGFFIKKIEKQKNVKIKAINGNKNTMPLPEVRHTSSLQPIQKGYITKVQDLWSSDSKQIGTYKGNGKIDKILMISQSNLVMAISNKLRNYFLDKLKFINKLPLFQEIPRNVIQEKLQKFKLMKIFFNDLIYSQELRPTCMFILLKGEAVIETGKKSQGIIVKPPNILADQKLDQNEKGRCTTQFCICFAVQKVDVEGILKRKAEIDKRQFQGMSKTSTIGLLRANYFRNCQIKSQQQENKEQQQQQVGKNCSQSNIDSMMKKIRNKNKDILTSLSNKTVKKQRIRQHFSNFLNQRYKQYSSKLEKNLPKDREVPILYHIKSLSPSTPNYDEIQAKLREQRLKNILDPKQSTPRSNSSQYLLRCIQNAQSRKESFVLQNGCIRDKILKKLQYSIALQISKKYGGRMKLV